MMDHHYGKLEKSAASHASRRRILGALAVLLGLVPLLIAPRAGADTDWVLVLDRSESMTQNDPYNFRFDAQKIMVDLLAQSVAETHRLSIVRFAGTPEVVLEREAVRPDRIEAIQKTIVNDPPQGDTDIGAALALARKVSLPEGRASDVHVILLSDGVQAGKIPNLQSRLEAEKQTYQELGLAVWTIVLNDFSISASDREARRKRKIFYDDRLLQTGEDLLRDVARKTGGNSIEVRPEKGIEAIILEILSPYLSYHRDKITTRLETAPTDRQLFLLLEKQTKDMKLRLGATELDVYLDRPHTLGGDFEVTVNPYLNRTVVMIRPAENVRWPPYVEFLPGRSGSVIAGDIFVIPNVLLSTLSGTADTTGSAKTSGEGVKTRILENELYPIRFRLTPAADLSPDRSRIVVDALKKASVRIRLEDGVGALVEEKRIAAADVLSGTGSPLYFVPTYSQRGETKLREPFGLVVKASLDGGQASELKRDLARAAERSFVVNPSEFQWSVRTRWGGQPDGAAKVVQQREIELDLGEELQLEIAYTGAESLPESEMRALYTRPGEVAAQRLALHDAGGTPRVFQTDWVFPIEPGLYTSRVSVKSSAVQEVTYSLRVVRDDFRLAGSSYRPDGTDTGEPRNLGAFFTGERMVFSRQRSVDRLAPEATEKYLQGEGAAVLRSQLYKKDAGGQGWVTLRPIPLEAAGSPAKGEAKSASVSLDYTGSSVAGEAGEYLVVWPEKRPMREPMETDPRCDRFTVRGPAFDLAFVDSNGRPLPMDAGKPSALAGTVLQVQITPTGAAGLVLQGKVTGTLTWARKDVGGPQVVEAVKGPSGLSLAFPTTDFHTGPARLALRFDWRDGQDRSIEESFEVFARTKALGVAMEPIAEDVLIGERGSAIQFRVRPIGGENSQAQRDLLSVWQSQPANATLGDSEKIYEVALTREDEALIGSLPNPGLEPGSYKLVVSSPVAKLGQDIAACFFNVKAPPFAVNLLRHALEGDPQELLGSGVQQTVCDGEGAVVFLLESQKPQGAVQPLEISSATILVNGQKEEVEWRQDGAEWRSSALALENFERRNDLRAVVADSAGRTFDLPVGELEVLPVPLRFEVVWSRSLPQEMGRGEYTGIAGKLRIHGGLRAQREKARDELLSGRQPLLVGVPASVLEGLELSRGQGAADVGQATPAAAFGEVVAFRARLSARAGQPDLKGRFTLQVHGADAQGANLVVSTHEIGIGPPLFELVVGRPDAQGAVTPPEDLPLVAKEPLTARLESRGSRAERLGSVRHKIEVFAAGADQEERSLASAMEAHLDWSARREGEHIVRAESVFGEGDGWTAEARIQIEPSLDLDWAQQVGTSMKLDSGQKLPLLLRVKGPPSLEPEQFDRWFQIKAQVLGEGSQDLIVELTPWETTRGAAPGEVLVSAFSTKPLSSTASRVRIALMRRDAGTPDAGLIDSLDTELVRGGGSLVQVEGAAADAAAGSIKDLPSTFEVAVNTPIRLGYRVGSSLDVTESLKSSVSVAVSDPEGSERVLDVDFVKGDLVVFTPFEGVRPGRHVLSLKISGKTPLLRDFEFMVAQSAAQRVFAVLGYAGAGAGLLLAIVLLARQRRGARDKAIVRQRVGASKAKALEVLAQEPQHRLAGSVRISVGSLSFGPFEVKGTPSPREVESWVNEHLPVETALFGDPVKDEQRQGAIQGAYREARRELAGEVGRRLMAKGIDICVSENVGPGGRAEPVVVEDVGAPRGEGQRLLLSLRVQADGSLRASTPSGKSVSMAPGEDFAYNGWVGKGGPQLRASIKVPGFADYATVVVDLKS